MKAAPAPIKPALAKRIAAVKAAIEAQPGAKGSSLPSARGVTLHKVMDKMFAILEVNKFIGVIVKSDPHLVELMKEKYDGIAHRGHLDRRFWISVNLDADVPTKEIEKLVAHSYEQIASKLTRKEKEALASAKR